MMNKILFFLLTLFTVSGCGPRYVDYFPYHDDGTAKPVVAMVPVIDSAGTDLPWNLSQVVSDAIRYEVMNEGCLFMVSEQEVQQCLQTFSQIDFLMNEGEISQKFDNVDYVVIPELMEYACVPYTLSQQQFGECASTLLIKLRLRVIDIRRSRCPRVVLQEVITQSYSIPVNVEDLFGFEGIPPEYCATPVGKAHQRFARTVACRMQEVMRGVR